MSNIIWNAWDSQKGQEYTVRDEVAKESFSNLEHGFLVVEVVGDFRWEEKINDFAKEFSHASKIGCFEHRPWQKASLALLRESRAFQGAIQSTDGAVRGRFDVSQLGELIGIWSSAGRWDSGEWLIAGLSSTAQECADFRSKNFVHELRTNQHLQIALELQEMKQSFIFARESSVSTPGLLSMLENL